MRHVDTFRAFAPTGARAERPRAPRGREGGPSFLSSALPGKLSLLPTANSDACYWQADKAAQFLYLFNESSSLQITHVCLHVTLCLVLCDLTSKALKALHHTFKLLAIGKMPGAVRDRRKQNHINIISSSNANVQV